MRSQADYFDGRSSTRRPVLLQLAGDELQLSGDGIESVYALAQVRIAAPLGSINGTLYFPDGGKCVFNDGRFLHLLGQRQRKSRFFSRVHRWESSLKLAFIALAATVLLVAAFIHFGLPLIAEQVAYAIPPATENTLGKETLQFLDRAVFAPSETGEERRQQLDALFADVVAALDASERPYHIELRHAAKVGANAFALPGGTIILTDELIALADNDDEIAAVIAHEVGHVRHRHAMRQVIQSSAVALMLAALNGDVFSASSMAASLPTVLLDAEFSRDMEREADDVAREYLVGKGASVECFVAILSKLEQEHQRKTGTNGQKSGVADYFSSHPATAERIARLRQQPD